jgi:hypothetical protein
MKAKSTVNDVRAGTTYVELDRDQHAEIQGRMIEWITLLNEGVRDPKNDMQIFFDGHENLPRMSRGRPNSVTSYLAGILNNQLFRPNPKTGRYQQDFTKDNIDWIESISIGMNRVFGTETIEFSESVWG